ncbi:MAG: hypothetical protein KF683_24055 [Rubrivivax sp.]|nr:hypothetical protein [Rubrivivax sp.]
MLRHASRPPEIASLLGLLSTAQVRFVVAGSVATLLHGGPVQPGDLDIVPDLAADNLARLAGVLADLEAVVSDVDHIGSWERAADGEWTWHRRPATPAERESLRSWQPRPADPASFDQLLFTRLGNLDIVPVIAGEHATLAARASAVAHHGVTVLVAHVDDLLAALTVPRRAKDVERVRYLRRLQREGAAG